MDKECIKCEKVLSKHGIDSLSEFRKWARSNHPDKGGAIY